VNYDEVPLGVECALPQGFEPRRRAQPKEKGGREKRFPAALGGFGRACRNPANTLQSKP